MAIPLEVGEKIEGALLAGLPRKRATLETLARIELRALLAARVFENERRSEALKQKQLWQTALLEYSKEPVVLVDRQARIVGMSRAARDMAMAEGKGLAPASDSQRFAELFPDGHWENVHEWLESGVGDLQCELKGGRKVSLKRLTLSGQEFTAVGLRRIEQDEAQPTGGTQEALKQALEWLDEGVVVFDEAGEILASNTRFLQIFGLPERGRKQLRTLEDLIGRVAKNAAEPQSFAADWRSLAEDGTNATREELEMAKPALHKIERCTRQMVGQNGEKMGRVEVYREMTARRIFESRMVQTEKLASLGQRVTGIIHELSNPLTTILGNAQRMVAQEGEGRHSAEARQILREAERAADIARQLLHLSRENQSETQLVSLNELVEKTMELQKEALAEGGLRLCVETAGELPRVNGDFGKLQQALLNLLQNAQQAVQESGKGGTIGVRTVCAEPGRVRLEVWDDGPGVPEALQARIFEPFFTTKPAGKGTGLGLAIVNNFAREHGGTISVHSPPEGGAKFVLEFPAAGEAREELPGGRKMADRRAGSLPACYRQSKPLLPGIPENTPHILVVEDEPTVASLIADVLRDEGMHVDVFPDGEKALEAARHKSYDLAICDLRMPRMDGQILYGALVENRIPLQEHVLFVTGDEIAQRTREFLEAHHLPHVAKPFRVEELCQAVRKMLSGQPASSKAIAKVGREERLGNWMNP